MAEQLTTKAALAVDCATIGSSAAVLAVPDFEPPLEPEPPATALASVAPPPVPEESATVLNFPASRFPEPPPDPNQWAQAIILATFEALHGVRAPLQLRRWLAPPVHAAVTARAACTRRPGSTPPRVFIRSVRNTIVTDGRVEGSSVVEVAGRCRAVAFEMRTYDGRWRFTALEVG